MSDSHAKASVRRPAGTVRLEPGGRLELARGAVSQHVAALRDAGLLTTHRDRRHVVCRRTSLADERVAATTPTGG